MTLESIKLFPNNFVPEQNSRTFAEIQKYPAPNKKKLPDMQKAKKQQNKKQKTHTEEKNQSTVTN